MTDHDSGLPVGMAGLRYPITQVSLAVRDLDTTMAAYHRVFGWQPWNVFEHRLPVHHDTELRGRSVHYALRGAEVYVGDLNFELLEPTEGPNLWTEFMDARGEGIASIAVMFKEKDEGDAAKAAFKSRYGIDVTMLAHIGDHIEYYYLDTEARFGCLIESGSGHAIDFVHPAYEFPLPATPASVRPPGLDLPITQVSLVVADLESALAAYHEAFGWGPWNVHGGEAMGACQFRGAPAAFAARFARTRVGDLEVELIEPLGGASPWQEHLDGKGPGIISIGIGLASGGDVATARAHLEAQGIGVLAQATMGDGDWLLMDAEQELKCLVALASVTSGAGLTPLRVYP